jgi:hypothetical protein
MRDIMDMQKSTEFLMWCTIINGALLILSAAVFISVPDTMYQIQSKLFPMPQETFAVVMYVLLGLFKILWLVFNAVPYGAMAIIGKNSAP